MVQPMEYTTFGRTGLRVSVAGLGCGGGSQLGMAQNKSEAHSMGLIRQAMDLGVNLIDTARVYGTESIVGKAIKSVPRDQVIISTKQTVNRGGQETSAEDIVNSVDEALRQIDTDYIDIFHLHSLSTKTYQHAKNILVPALLREKEKGKIRFLGATELGPMDHGHDMLSLVFKDDLFDVVMLAFNIMHQNARTLVFPQTQALGIGTMIMFAVRAVFSVPGRLQQDVSELVEAGQLPEWFKEKSNPLDFLIHEGGAESVIDAAYRYVRHQKGTDVILFGTGDPEHLKTNLSSILKPPLPSDDVEKIHELFGHLVGVGLDYPGGRKPQQ